MSDRRARSDPRNEVLTEQRVTYHIEIEGRLLLVENVPARVNVETGNDTSLPSRSNGYSKQRGGAPGRCASSKPPYSRSQLRCSKCNDGNEIELGSISSTP